VLLDPRAIDRRISGDPVLALHGHARVVIHLVRAFAPRPRQNIGTIQLVSQRFIPY